MQSTRGAAILAAVAVLTGGLAACGDDSEPQESTTTASPIDRSTDSPSSSESSSSSGSETSSASGEGKVAKLPEEAQAKTKEGAIAFNEWYLTQVGESLKTADSTTVRAYSSDCAFCDEIAKTADQFAKDGITADKNPYSLQVQSAKARTDSGYRVEVLLNISEYRKVASDGRRGPAVKPSSITLVTNTKQSAEGWRIHEVVRTK
ncbi:hypothetical protein SAMN06296429_105167 [Janibacter indicus]|uniref:DUF6318 domain-containing protein n=1 Tax=Janibacter indicus TaxID=857417 RepID=A0A1W2A971_9MICO|nr:hypothetical protein SAMN06296429_105167 [Janibacter indicus]